MTGNEIQPALLLGFLDRAETPGWLVNGQPGQDEQGHARDLGNLRRERSGRETLGDGCASRQPSMVDTVRRPMSLQSSST